MLRGEHWNRLLNDLGAALFGATLYLLSFTIPNLQLAGLIDAGEACFMAAVIWSLLTGKWYLLPIWGVVGALAKETFVPFSCVLAFTWWLVNDAKTNLECRKAHGVSSNGSRVGNCGLATVMAVHSVVAGQLKWPWNIAGQARAPLIFFVALWNCLTERSFWYVFGWLIPFGIWRLKCFPKPWLVASITTSGLAIMLGRIVAPAGRWAVLSLTSSDRC